ncbi:hypothetical protein WMF39_45210 [Sorangium sp. So ce1504]|uniref:hypothetical protein n=1 Tax=Sorangium sp. So ce1504 TaxID=3133337 RepID=UPI003F609B9B
MFSLRAISACCGAADRAESPAQNATTSEASSSAGAGGAGAGGAGVAGAGAGEAGAGGAGDADVAPLADLQGCHGEKRPLVVSSQMPYAVARIGAAEGHFLLDFGATASLMSAKVRAFLAFVVALTRE